MSIDVTNVNKITHCHDQCDAMSHANVNTKKCINLSLYFSQRNHRDPWMCPVEDQKSAIVFFPPRLSASRVSRSSSRTRTQTGIKYTWSSFSEIFKSPVLRSNNSRGIGSPCPKERSQAMNIMTDRTQFSHSSHVLTILVRCGRNRFPEIRVSNSPIATVSSKLPSADMTFILKQIVPIKWPFILSINNL